MNTAEQLVEALVAEGVSMVFGIPGDENLPFIQAVSESEEIDFILTRHEAAAGFMAAAHGHLTGRLAVAMSTLGAGATNLATPVAHAWPGWSRQRRGSTLRQPDVRSGDRGRRP